MQHLPAPLLQQIAFARHGQDFRLLEQALAQALRLAPADLDLRVQHATALGQCGEYAAAGAAFKKMSREVAAERRNYFRGVIGAAWRNAGRPDLAEPHLREACADPQSPLGAHEAWVDALERLNRLPEAAAAATQGLRRFPDAPSLRLLLARVLRRLGDGQQAEALLRLLLATPLPLTLRLEVSSELGRVLDEAGRFAEAFAAFCEGKEAYRAQSAPALGFWRQRTNHLRLGADLPTAADFARWAHGPRTGEAQRLAFLTGCPRSGTTLLERVLDAHSGICAAPETQAWRCDAWLPLLRAMQANGTLDPQAGMLDVLKNLTPDALRASRAGYRRTMALALEQEPGRRLLVDKNPSLFTMIPALVRLFPESKQVVALRDPRAIVWSCFTQSLSANGESVAFLNLATAAEHVAVSLGNWLKMRDRLATPWCEVRYEAVVRDLPGEARKLTDFLGLPWEDGMLAFHQSAKPVHSPSYASASQPISARAAEHWRHYEAFMAPHLAALGPVMAALGYPS